MARYVAALVAVLAMIFAPASPAAAITNGDPDGDWHPFVGVAVGNGFFCSGTLIGSNVFLTAGHCIWDFGGPDNAANVVVSFAPDLSYADPGYQATAAAMYVEPNGYDVGIILLGTDMSAFGQGYLPAPGAVDQLGNNASLLAVGYGFTGFTPGGGPPQPAGGGTRLFAWVTFINNKHNLAPQFIKHSTNPGQGQGGTCYGDSGGPIFADDGVTILGISSFGQQNCHGNSFAQRIDIDPVLPWISSFLAN